MLKNIGKYIPIISKLIVIIILIISGVGKIIDPIKTIGVLNAFEFFSEEINILITSVLPIIEITLAVLLFLSYKLIFINISTLLLFIGFLIISILGYAIGLNEDCGCFGELVNSTFGLTMIFRNFCFVILTIIVYKNKNAWPGKT